MFHLKEMKKNPTSTSIQYCFAQGLNKCFERHCASVTNSKETCISFSFFENMKRDFEFKLPSSIMIKLVY